MEKELLDLCRRALEELANIKDIGLEVDDDLYEDLREVCGYIN
jgi:hypothetical protein